MVSRTLALVLRLHVTMDALWTDHPEAGVTGGASCQRTSVCLQLTRVRAGHPLTTTGIVILAVGCLQAQESLLQIWSKVQTTRGIPAAGI